MKKSAKIWKIEHHDLPIYDGMYTECNYPKITTQFIFDSELDCVLDIVTEPDNFGLKVYKHQTKITEEKDLTKSGKFGYFTNECPYISSKYFSEETYINGDVPTGYKLSTYSKVFAEYHGKTQYHWVEVFMQ